MLRMTCIDFGVFYMCWSFGDGLLAAGMSKLSPEFDVEMDMKKLSVKRRAWDVKRSLKLRKSRALKNRTHQRSKYCRKSWIAVQRWIIKEKKRGLRVFIDQRNNASLTLPPAMNLSENFSETIQHLTAIRNLCELRSASSRALKLRYVNFNELKKISTSAALVLTAELSKWDDTLRQKLKPRVEQWDPKIARQFAELGFFNLFSRTAVDQETSIGQTGNLGPVEVCS